MEKKWLSKDETKLRQTWKSIIERRKNLRSVFMKSIKNLNLNDFSYIMQVDGHIRLRETKISLYGELEMRNRLFRENQAKDCQEIEELRRTCCEEADRARQARIDELSMHQERRSPMLTQIRELQNKVNSLSDAKEFYDPETASSSGATHVPDQSPKYNFCFVEYFDSSPHPCLVSRMLVSLHFVVVVVLLSDRCARRRR